VEGIREILDFVAANPGCTKAELMAQLFPGAAPAAEGAPAPVAVEAEAEAAVPAAVEGEAVPVAPVAPVAGAVNPKESEFKRQVQWLVEKGHVIEFSDGRMAVPATAVARVQMARPKGKGRR
jgi:hypothetical protein